MMTLYGSVPSPFVRRIRMLLHDIPHEFVDLMIFEGPDRELLASKNPTMKVPMLEDDEHVVFDSRVIFRYLTTKLGWAPLDWTQENQLTLIDAVNDSFVQLLLLRRSELDIAPDSLYMRLHTERVEQVMDTLEGQVGQGCYQEWGYPAMCLYSLLDWVVFRALYPLDDYPGLLDFMQEHQHRICVTATDPRG